MFVSLEIDCLKKVIKHKIEAAPHNKKGAFIVNIAANVA